MEVCTKMHQAHFFAAEERHCQSHAAQLRELDDPLNALFSKAVQLNFSVLCPIIISKEKQAVPPRPVRDSPEELNDIPCFEMTKNVPGSFLHHPLIQ